MGSPEGIGVPRAMLTTVSEKPYIGGQAVIEGVMMRSPKSFAVAVRRQSGEIVIREEPWKPVWAGWKPLRWPFLRGGTVLVESLSNGFSALRFASDQAAPPDAKQTKTTSFAMTLSVIAAVVLFIGLPHAMASWLGLDARTTTFHLVAGVAKLTLLLGYMAAISRVAEIRRVFQYHGAEHKAIFTYEAGLALEVENARGQSRFHPRCGTTFLIVFVAASILVFSVAFLLVPKVTSISLLQRAFEIVCKLPLLFPIAGLAYELQRFTAKRTGAAWVRALMAPGMAVQKITTREPTDDQIEVALAALRITLWRENAGLGAPDSKAAPLTFPSFAAFAAAIEAWKGGELEVAA